MVTLLPVVDFDYVNRKVYATLQSASGIDWNSAIVDLISPRGYIASHMSVTPSSYYDGFALGMASGNMYINAANYGVFDQDATNANNYLWYSEMWSQWRLSSMATSPYEAVISGYESGTVPPSILVSQTDNSYAGIPVLITRGDAVGHFQISSVSGRNSAVVNTDPTLSAYLNATQLSDCVAEVLSGARSGQRFYVSAYNTSTNAITTDIDVSSYSGDYIKLMPYRHITAYSGWETYLGHNNTPEFDSSPYFNTFNGIIGRFTLDKARPTQLGSRVNGRTISYVGDVNYDLNNILQAGAPGLIYVPATQARISKEVYMRQPALGDIVLFTPESDISATSGALVLSVEDVGTAWEIEYYPQCQPSSVVDAATIYRANEYELLTAPKFDTDYLVSLSLNGQHRGHSVVRSPSAEVEVSVNEYESTYNAIGDRTHFHIGPVHLSNGQTLPNTATLRLSGALYQGDVTSSSPVTSWYRHGTMNTSIGTVAQGQYSKLGVLTTTYNASLNASETLYLKVVAEYGAASIDRVITIPVHPSV